VPQNWKLDNKVHECQNARRESIFNKPRWGWPWVILSQKSVIKVQLKNMWSTDSVNVQKAQEVSYDSSWDFKY
jgi:hypothetical protein